MSIYTVQDSQGYTFGVFHDLEKAKAALLGHAESICDVCEVRDILHLTPIPTCISTVVAIVFDECIIWKSNNEGFTVIEWYQENASH